VSEYVFPSFGGGRFLSSPFHHRALQPVKPSTAPDRKQGSRLMYVYIYNTELLAAQARYITLCIVMVQQSKH
jgi:hypothetical protein